MKLLERDNKVHPTLTDESWLIRTKPIMKPKEYAKDERVAVTAFFSKNNALSGLMKLKVRRSIISSQFSPSSQSEKKRKIIVINHEEEVWNLEVHGGIKMWVNAETGEVSLQNPKAGLPLPSERKLSTSSVLKNKNRKLAAVFGGHRSKNYDNYYSSTDKEVQEMLEMLDPKSNLKQLLNLQ